MRVLDRPGKMPAGADGPDWLLSTVPEPSPSAIRAELQKILLSHPFENSKRCQAFLRYIVEQTVAGHSELKERIIGIEVFDRIPSYDTNVDPVVRMTAGEVRKRLALYYAAIEGTPPIRLELPLGGYIPRFAVSPRTPPLPLPELTPAEAEPSPALSSPELPLQPSIGEPENPSRPDRSAFTSRVRNLRFAWAAVPIALLLILAAAITYNHAHKPVPTALDLFWQPVLGSPDPVLISIGQIVPVYAEVHPNAQRSSLQSVMEIGKKHGYPPQIAVAVLGDAMPMANIAALLATHNKPYAIKPQANTSFADLQANSVVLVGAFDNDWTLNLTDKLRFHFSTDHGDTWISDREHPDAKIGLLTPDETVQRLKADYGLVVRMYDEQTKKMVVIVAGLAPFGTQAGGDLITNPAFLQEYARTAPPGWERKNIEILYRTDLIDGETSPPQIATVGFW